MFIRCQAAVEKKQLSPQGWSSFNVDIAAPTESIQELLLEAQQRWRGPL